MRANVIIKNADGLIVMERTIQDLAVLHRALDTQAMRIEVINATVTLKREQERVGGQMRSERKLRAPIK